MDKIKIREALESDAPKLANLMAQLGYPISNETMLERMQIYHHNPLYFTYVAEKDHCVIGSISIVITEFFHRPTHFARIVSMVIDENCRRQGVGKKLIEYAEILAKKQECSFIELSSGMHREKIGSHDFYFSLGYKDPKDKKRYFVKEL